MVVSIIVIWHMNFLYFELFLMLGGIVMIKFKEAIEMFLKYNTSEGYDKDVAVFRQYLNCIRIQEEKAITFLQGIRTKEIINSLDYYINKNGVSSIETALRYISCIKEFLSYLIDKEIIINSELTKEFGLPTYSEKSFRNIVNKYIDKDKRLKERKDFVAFSEVEIQSLIKDCDDTLKDSINIEKACDSKKYFNRVRAAIIIKLIIFCGIRYEHLHRLSFNSIDLVHNTISINGFIIHIPHNLRDQFVIYEEIINDIGSSNSERKFLFVNYNGSKMSDKTNTISDHLRNYTGRRDVNGLIKYTVINMILKGVNESVIKKFTGIASSMYKPCQEEVNKKLSMNTNRYLDSKLRSIHTFDIL